VTLLPCFSYIRYFFPSSAIYLLFSSIILPCIYEGRLKNSWTHFIAPSRNFVEVRWRSLFRSISLGLQRSTHFSKTCCRPLIAWKFLASELPFHGWKSPEVTWAGRGLNRIPCSAWKKWIGGTPLEHPPYSPDLAPWDFWNFPTIKRELRGKKFRSGQRSAVHFREVGGAL
jgi:hypothetical protein